jgi:hypothetical protein
MLPDAHRIERSGPRYRRRFKVVLPHSAAFTVDIGVSGFCTQVLRVLTPGSLVEGTIQVNGTDIPFAGRVAWAKPGDPRLSIPGRMGLLLTRTSREYTNLLAAAARPRS